MGLREMEAKLPPGFRFHPRDDELVCHYLYKKIIGNDHERFSMDQILMVEVNLHACEPWQLPDAAKIGANEWYFFSFRDCKYATGPRKNRATMAGYWKATGKDKPVFDYNNEMKICNLNKDNNMVIGMRKTLVFYCGRAPNGTKTSWIMHEFRLLENFHIPFKEDWVLCRVFNKGKEKELNINNLDTDQNDYHLNTTMDDLKISSSSIYDQTMASHGYQQQLDTSFAQNPQFYYQDDDHINNPSNMIGFQDLQNFKPKFLELPREIILYPSINNEMISENEGMMF